MKVRKKNSRRFFRYPAEISYHIVPVEDSRRYYACEIYTTGINYFSKKTLLKLDRAKNLSLKLLDRAAFDHREVVGPFKSILEKIDFVRQELFQVQDGINPILELGKSAAYDDFSKPVDLSMLQSSIRTKEYLSQMDQKACVLVRYTKEVLKESTETNLHAMQVPNGFEIDHSIQKLKAVHEKSKSSFAGSLIELFNYLDIVTNVMGDMFNVMWYTEHPETWEKQVADLSCGGVKIKTDYLYEKGDLVDFYIQFSVPENCCPDGTYTDKVQSKVVFVREVPDGYEVALSFVMVKEQTMRAIDGYLLSLEARKALAQKILISRGSGV